LIFSSSATVYGSAVYPINESSTVGVGITNPYGRSKFFIEQILEDLATSPEGKIWGLVTLRYVIVDVYVDQDEAQSTRARR